MVWCLGKLLENGRGSVESESIKISKNMSQITIKQSVEKRNLELLLVATYFLGFQTSSEGYSLTHPEIKKHLDNLKNILGNLDEVVESFKKKKRKKRGGEGVW